MYSALARAEATSAELVDDVKSFDSNNSALVIQLGALYTVLIGTAENKFSVLVAAQVYAEKSELDSCRAAHPAASH